MNSPKNRKNNSGLPPPREVLYPLDFRVMQPVTLMERGMGTWDKSSILQGTSQDCKAGSHKLEVQNRMSQAKIKYWSQMLAFQADLGKTQ